MSKTLKIDHLSQFEAKIPKREGSSSSPNERGRLPMTSDTFQFSDASNREVDMNNARKVPGIGRGPQQFSRATMPPMQSPMMSSHQPTQFSMPAAEAETVEDQIHSLAMEIYAGLIVDLIASGSGDREAMQTLAKHSQAAAREFFHNLEIENAQEVASQTQDIDHTNDPKQV